MKTTLHDPPGVAALTLAACAAIKGRGTHVHLSAPLANRIDSYGLLGVGGFRQQGGKKTDSKHGGEASHLNHVPLIVGKLAPPSVLHAPLRGPPRTTGFMPAPRFGGQRHESSPAPCTLGKRDDRFAVPSGFLSDESTKNKCHVAGSITFGYWQTRAVPA